MLSSLGITNHTNATKMSNPYIMNGEKWIGLPTLLTAESLIPNIKT